MITENSPSKAGVVPGIARFGPMPLGLEPQALAGLLERSLHLPAFHEPRDDPLRIGIEVGAQKSLGFELPLGSRISTQRTGTAGKPVEYQTAVSETISTVRCEPLYQSLTEMGFHGFGIFGHRREVRQALALQARSAHLSRLARRSRLVEGGVESEASDEGDGVSQMPAAIQVASRTHIHHRQRPRSGVVGTSVLAPRAFARPTR